MFFFNFRLSTLQNELSEERGLAAALANSQAEWQARAKLREENFVKEVNLFFLIHHRSIAVHCWTLTSPNARYSVTYKILF